MSPPDGGRDPRSVESLAAETERGFDSKPNLPSRLIRYAAAKERACAMRDFISRDRSGDKSAQQENTRLAHELHHCGSYLVFREYLESKSVRLHAMRSCRLHLLCPLCAIRRGAKLVSGYLERVEFVSQERSRFLQMLTLTVRDGDVLHERFSHLRSSLKRLFKRRHLVRGSEMEKIAGAVWAYEVKRGSGSGVWHPHVHAFLLCDERVDPVALSREWKEITDDSHVLDCHDVYGQVADAFCEVFKYSLKFGDLSLVDNFDAYKLLRRRRLIGSCGALWGVDVPEDLTDDPIFSEQYVEHLYRFARELGYVDVDTGECFHAKASVVGDRRALLSALASAR